MPTTHPLTAPAGAVAAPLWVAQRYLRVERVYRIELRYTVAQTPRVSYMEAVDLADADAYADDLALKPRGNRVIDVRRATEADAAEFADLEEWYG
jgi:hypothetical protein